MNAVSPSLLSCLVNTSETIAGATFGGAWACADTKAKVFSRRRKYIRQTNDVSDQRKAFAVAGADRAARLAAVWYLFIFLCYTGSNQEKETRPWQNAV